MGRNRESRNVETATASRDVLLAAVALLLLIAAVASSVIGKAEPAVTATHVVSSGDTLWNLAERHPVHGLSTAQTVDLIERMNGLESALLEPGVSIALPAAPDDDTVRLAMR